MVLLTLIVGVTFLLARVGARLLKNASNRGFQKVTLSTWTPTVAALSSVLSDDPTFASEGE